MKALQKFPVLIAGLAIVIIASLAISVPAGATAGPSRRVLNVQTLYSYLVYPNNQLLFPTSGKSAVDALFSSSTQGRIAPFGEGHDLTTVKKYFFGVSPGLGPGSSAGEITSTLTGVTFRSITDQPPLVIVEVDLSFTPTPLGEEVGLQPYQVRETGQFTFNKTFQITSFDLSIPYIDSAMALAGQDFTNPTFVPEQIEGICSVTMASCTGQNAQYPDLATCESALSSLPVGNWNRTMNQNSVSCRSFHTQFLPIDPTNECAVVGPNGGTQCLNSNTYQSYFTETF